MDTKEQKEKTPPQSSEIGHLGTGDYLKIMKYFIETNKNISVQYTALVN